MSQKKKRLKYKKYCRLLRDDANNRLSTMAINTDMSLKSTKEFNERVPTIQELLDSPLANFITLAAKDCGFTGTSGPYCQLCTFFVPQGQGSSKCRR